MKALDDGRMIVGFQRIEHAPREAIDKMSRRIVIHMRVGAVGRKLRTPRTKDVLDAVVPLSHSAPPVRGRRK